MQLANKRLLYAQRLHKDIAELFSHDFSCSSSNMSVIQQKDEENINQRGYLILKIRIFEGPYRGGCYGFSLDIPECYPFHMVDIYASQPIWHPNIDLFSGKVTLPLEWSPVLTLNSLALGVQMIMLEPSAENPSNIEALSYYISNTEEFDKCTQRSIQGNFNIAGVRFASVLFSREEVIPQNDHKSRDIIYGKCSLNKSSMNQKLQNRTNTVTTTTYPISKKRSLSNDGDDNEEFNNYYYDNELNQSSSMDTHIQPAIQLLHDNSLLLDQLSLQSTTINHHNENDLSIISNININPPNPNPTRDKNKRNLGGDISMNNSSLCYDTNISSTISPKRLKKQHSNTILSNI